MEKPSKARDMKVEDPSRFYSMRTRSIGNFGLNRPLSTIPSVSEDGAT